MARVDDEICCYRLCGCLVTDVPECRPDGARVLPECCYNGGDFVPRKTRHARFESAIEAIDGRLLRPRLIHPLHIHATARDASSTMATAMLFGSITHRNAPVLRENLALSCNMRAAATEYFFPQTMSVERYVGSISQVLEMMSDCDRGR